MHGNIHPFIDFKDEHTSAAFGNLNNDKSGRLIRVFEQLLVEAKCVADFHPTPIYAREPPVHDFTIFP